MISETMKTLPRMKPGGHVGTGLGVVVTGGKYVVGGLVAGGVGL